MKHCPACFHENPESASACQNSACGYRFDVPAQETKAVQTGGESRNQPQQKLIAGRFQVERELGRGGMGVVYQVDDIQLNETVALKIIHPSLVGSRQARQRFLDEVRISRQLNHANIVRVYDIGDWEGLLFFTMEYVKGYDLRQLMLRKKKSSPPFGVPEITDILIPALNALSYAHRFTVHRDIKPENIMISGEGPNTKIKLLDFGIAKTLTASRLSLSAHAMGTPYYIAPEQLEDATHVDNRADLFSMGAVLYELLTGNKYIGIPRMPSKLFPEIPPEADQIITRLLRHDPGERYPDADSVISSLNQLKRSYEERVRERERLREQKRRIKDVLTKVRKAYGSSQWSEAEKRLKELSILDPANDRYRSLLEKVQKKIEAKQTEEKLPQETAYEEPDLEMDFDLEEELAHNDGEEARILEDTSDIGIDALDAEVPPDLGANGSQIDSDDEKTDSAQGSVAILPSETVQDVKKGLPADKLVPRVKKIVRKPVFLILILVLLPGGLYGVYTVLDGMGIRIPLVSDMLNPLPPDPGNLKISTMAINSRFVETATLGKMFVVTGKIRNDYETPRSSVRIIGKLYGSGKKLRATNAIYAGNIISGPDLAGIDLDGINRRLNEQNLRVRPGSIMPFMVVFANLPDDLEEFTVEVVSSTE